MRKYMKIDKLVSITVINSFLLLLLGAFMSSCQKGEFPKSGLLTKWHDRQTSPGRSIASVDPNDDVTDRFIKFQDPNQVILFCEISSKRPQSCYQDKFSMILNKYIKINSLLTATDATNIKEKFSFSNMKIQYKAALKHIHQDLEPRMNKLADYREKFCHKNSTHYLNKCLTQYLDKDTFTVLNEFHNKNKMNGHEYLYFKGYIKDQLNQKLMRAQVNINKHQKSI